MFIEKHDKCITDSLDRERFPTTMGITILRDFGFIDNEQTDRFEK